MDKIKVLNEMKALEMKKQHIETVDSEINHTFQGKTTITINGKNISVSVSFVKTLFEMELRDTKIEYDGLLKSLVDDIEGGF